MAFSEDAKRFARSELEKRRQYSLTKAKEVEAEIRSKCPEYVHLERERRSINLLRMRATMQNDLDQAETLKKGLDEIDRKIETALQAKGFSATDLLPHYSCPRCSDTGFLSDGSMCSCFTSLMSEYEATQIKEASPLALSSFDTFRLDYYPSEADKTTGIVPRNQMKFNLDDCKAFCANFKQAPNLLMIGSAGLGKTHLALSIANEMLNKGVDVIYCSCSNIFSKIEEEKASYSRHSDTLDSLKRCSLLVLDDLGSEHTTPSVQALLYDILNTRISSGFKTIITTNFIDSDRSALRYGEKIISRLSGCFKKLYFIGDDIRVIKGKQL